MDRLRNSFRWGGGGGQTTGQTAASSPKASAGDSACDKAAKKAAGAAPRSAAQLALDQACVNNIRVLSSEMVEAAKSGHPGAPMGCAPMAYALFAGGEMRYAPSAPQWFNRDRFVLSNGHSCALLYSMLHLTGYERPSMADIKQFRQLDSVTAGHPENDLLDAVEVSTGPLGQGISNAVGLAVAQAHMAATFNQSGFPVIDNHTFVICGDGCLQEGVSAEASSLAGHLKLGRLVVLYDDNQITIDGSTSLSFTEDVGKRYEAYGWQVLAVSDGDSGDVRAIMAAVAEAKRCTDRPTLIKVRTTIGFGAKKQGTAGVHGAPLGWDDIRNVREQFGMDPEARFSVPDEVAQEMGKQRARGEAAVAEWDAMFERYAAEHPALASELRRRMAGEMPADWEKAMPSWAPGDKALATRQSGGKALNAAYQALPELVGGSADLTGSNGTKLVGATDFQAASHEGRQFHFGVREHGMAAVCNGMAAYGGLIPFGATFLNFCGYALGAMRLSALSRFRVLYIGTHDSIGLGEDGPTHQPVGMLATLRSIPNMYVFRPADANEVSGAYKVALGMKHSPSVFSLTRQALPNLEGSSVDAVAKGAYVVFGEEGDVVLVATGSEVALCIEAAELLREADGVSATVVSMPCWELFEEQTEEYKKSVFPKGVPVVAVEMASPLGWQKYSHAQVCMDDFGRSAPAPELFELFGFTPDNVAAKARSAIAKLGGNAQWLVDTI